MQCKCIGRRRKQPTCRTTCARPQAVAILLLSCRRRRCGASLPETCSDYKLDKTNFIRVAPHLLRKIRNFATSLLRKPRKGNNERRPVFVPGDCVKNRSNRVQIRVRPETTRHKKTANLLINRLLITISLM